MTPLPKPIAIIGAGLAGLTAAAMLRRHGVPFVLYEAGPQIAGLARSFIDEGGFTCDFGAHFITNRLAAAIGVSGQCSDTARYSETVWLRGRSIGYPFGLMCEPAYLISALASRVRLIDRSPAVTAEEWFCRKYGAVLAHQVAIPLIEAWSGTPAFELAASAADPLPISIARTIGLKLAGRLTKRAVAIGYCRSLPETVHIRHVYPQNGVATLCERLAKEIDGVVELNAPVEAIIVDGGQTVAVRVGGQDREVRAVVSTAPLPALARLVHGTLELAPLGRFKYRPMVFVNLHFIGRGLLPDVVVWTPERAYPFFRLTETPLAMPWLAPEGKTSVTADLGCEVGDATWNASDEALAHRCLDWITDIIPDARQRYIGCRVLRTATAYPVFCLEYEEDRRRFAKSTGIGGLVSVGRNGEFAHILMEDVYWRTLARVRPLLQS